MGRLLLSFALLLSSSLLLAATAAIGQTPAPLLDDLYYDSPFNGFRVMLPDGWVIEDRDSAIDPLVIEPETYFGFAELAKICPENAALPGIGGTHKCQAEKVGAPDITILRFTELKSNPQFASVLRQNKTIAPLDLLPLHLQAIETAVGFVNGGADVIFNIGEEQRDSIENMTIQVSEINPQTNQAVVKSSVQANFVQASYSITSSSSSDTLFSAPPVLNAKMFSLYVLSEDGNTGYAVFSPRWPEATPSAPSPIREIIDSFGLVRLSSSN